jgi:hypothetical protein
MIANNTNPAVELNRQTMGMLFPNKDYIPVRLFFCTDKIDQPGEKYFRLPKTKVAYSMGALNITIGDLTMLELQEYIDQTMEGTVYDGIINDVLIEEPPNYKSYTVNSPK